jgi:putative MATE family efflux protein
VKKVNQAEKYTRMIETPVEKLICRLAVPTILSMLVTSFYNMADTYFVGRIDTSATAAVGVIFSLMTIIQALGFLFGHGSGNYMSRKLGNKEVQVAEKVASTGFFSSFIVGTVLAILGLIFINPLARILGATDTMLPYAISYMQYILIGTPFMMTSLVLNNQLRFQGSAFYGMIGMVSGSIINIILNPIFIFVLDLGIGGAALATVVSQFISFCLLLIGTTKGGNIRIKFQNFTPTVHHYKEIVNAGLPSLARQGIASVATISMNLAAGPYGDAAIAALSIVSRIMFFAMALIIGFGQGFQPVCGFNYGAKLYDRVQQGFWFSVKVTTVLLLILAVPGILFADKIVTLFRKEDLEVIAIGTTALRLQCLALPFFAWITIANMMLQSIGKSAKATILALGRQGIFFLPIIWSLPHIFGLFGIQISQPIADIATFILSIPLVLGELERMKKIEEVVSESYSNGSQPQADAS